MIKCKYGECPDFCSDVNNKTGICEINAKLCPHFEQSQLERLINFAKECEKESNRIYGNKIDLRNVLNQIIIYIESKEVFGDKQKRDFATLVSDNKVPKIYYEVKKILQAI